VGRVHERTVDSQLLLLLLLKSPAIPAGNGAFLGEVLLISTAENSAAAAAVIRKIGGDDSRRCGRGA